MSDSIPLPLQEIDFFLVMRNLDFCFSVSISWRCQNQSNNIHMLIWLWIHLFTPDMLQIAEQRVFQNGWPVNSVIALSSHQFCIVGEIMVMSILQGGPAPTFLDQTVYSYISRTTLDPEKNNNILHRNVAKRVSFLLFVSWLL